MRTRTIRAAAGLLAFLPFLSLPAVLGQLVATEPVLSVAVVEAVATPDCGLVSQTDDARQQRAEHLQFLGVPQWHAAGCRGRGIKIAILDSGFRGYRDHLGKALPAKVQTASFRHDNNMEANDSQHGILCGEVLHALAPEAELLLATWEPNQPDQFLNAARWARQQGARIISCSVIMPSWSDGEGGGPIHAQLARVLGTGKAAGDLLFFASAGNTARRHWSGAFKDNGTGFHEWCPNQIDNLVKPWGEERVSVELCWQPGCRYQITVLDARSGEEVGRPLTSCDGERCFSVVRFLPVAHRRYQVRVRLLEGTAKPFHLVILGGDLDCGTKCGSVAFPGDGPAVIAVGAVDADGNRAAYSSCGPNSPALKPDFVSLVPFPSLWRDKPFNGTSAAAPQAAALAALCWSRTPDWSAAQVRQSLVRWVRDLGPQGHDWDTGHGLIILPPPDKQ